MTTIDRRYSVAEGVAIKAPCRVATTANITLAALQSIDGVTVVEHDRVLVKDQSTASENGIYEVSSGNWLRSKDCDGAYDVVRGTRVFVTSGATNAGTEFMLTTADPITITSTSLTWGAVVNPADEYPTRALAAAAVIPPTVTVLRTAGYATKGDGGQATFYRLGSTPSPVRSWHFQSSDGAYWILAEDVIKPEQLGAIYNDLTTDVGTKLYDAVEFAAGKTVEFTRLYYTTVRLILYSDTTVRFVGAGQIKSSLPRVFYGSALSNITFIKPKLRGPGSNIMPSSNADSDVTVDEDGLDYAVDFTGPAHPLVPDPSAGFTTYGGIGGAIDLRTCTRVRIGDCDIKDFYNGICSVSGSDCEISNPTIANFRLYGIVASGNDYTAIRGGYIHDCDQTRTKSAYAWSCTGNSNAGGDANILYTVIVDGLTVRNVTSWDGGMSHDVNCLTVCNCDYRGVRIALDISAVNTSGDSIRKVHIHDNYFEGTDTDEWDGVTSANGNPGDSAIYLTGGLDIAQLGEEIHIHDNTFRNFGKFTPSSGGVGAVTVNSCGFFNVHDNIFREIGDPGVASACIHVLGYLTGPGKVHNNTCEVVASGVGTGANTAGVRVTNTAKPGGTVFAGMEIRNNRCSNEAGAGTAAVYTSGNTIDYMICVNNPADDDMEAFHDSSNTYGYLEHWQKKYLKTYNPSVTVTNGNSTSVNITATGVNTGDNAQLVKSGYDTQIFFGVPHVETDLIALGIYNRSGGNLSAAVLDLQFEITTY